MAREKDPRRHVILLVEDDLDSAETTCEILDGLGYEPDHAASVEEAEPKLLAGGFCVAILDLELKLKKGSARADVNIGYGLLEHSRHLFPNRGENGKHLMQIIMMSAHDDWPHVRRMFQDLADDFVSKSFDDDGRTFRDSIRNSLRHSGRVDHADCCSEITRLARRVANAEPARAEPDPKGTIHLELRGIVNGPRTEIEVNGQTVPIQTASLIVLLLLVGAKLDNVDWVASKQHGATLGGWRPANRLEADVKKHVTGVTLLSSDRAGSYRLSPNVRIESVDWARLANHPDEKVKKLAAKRR